MGLYSFKFINGGKNNKFIFSTFPSLFTLALGTTAVTPSSTNSIENFNRQLRIVTKAKTIFPTDDSLFKSLYLAMMDATKKWTGKTWDWGLTLDQLCIYFEDRIRPEDID